MDKTGTFSPVSRLIAPLPGNSSTVAKPFLLRLPAVPDSVPTARHELAKIACGYGADLFAVKVVVTELVGNAVRHAYVDTDPGTVSITATSDDGALVIVVADDGAGMRTRLHTRGLGIGIALASKLADDLRIESDATGTTASATFALS
jgi:anti-sigma regulatory factor (Ser/Thr protein kinase)